MHQKNEHAAQGREKIERNDLFAATSGQGRLALQKERHVRTQCRRDFLELPVGERLVEQFVQPKERVGRVAAAAAQTGGERNSLFQMNAHTLGAARCLQKRGSSAMDQIC